MTLCGEGRKPLRKKGKNMAKKKQNENRSEVLIVKSTPLSDGWETDADRQPLCIISEEEAKKIFGNTAMRFTQFVNLMET